MLFLIINIAYIILPFGLARLHFHLNERRFNLRKLNFIYFLFFNVFLKAVPVALSAIMRGHAMALENGWAFSPLYAEYGISLLAIGLLGFFALFIRGQFRLATALVFALFSLFAGILHIVQFAQGVPLNSHNVITLVSFDFITAIILLYFIFNPKTRGHV